MKVLGYIRVSSNKQVNEGSSLLNQKNMIEDYYNIKLTYEQISKLPCKSEKMSHSTIRKYIEDYEDNYEKLLSFLTTK